MFTFYSQQLTANFPNQSAGTTFTFTGDMPASLTLSPAGLFFGPILSAVSPKFTVVATANTGDFTATSFTIPVNNPPEANVDTAATANGTLVTIDVLGNDTDANGNTLSITTVGKALSGTMAIVNGQVNYKPNATFACNDNFFYFVSDGQSGVDLASVTVTVTVANALPLPPVPPLPPLDKSEFVVGSDNGGIASYYDGNGNLIHSFDSFATAFPGVRPALGVFNGDGVSDIVAGTSPGVTAQVTIVDGVTLQPILTVQPFNDFQGGVFVASADFNGDGIADFAVGADAGAEPSVVVYLTLGGQLVETASFYAFEREFRGGVHLATGDIDGDGVADLIVGAGVGAGPAVAVLDGRALAQGTARRLIDDFYADAPDFQGGVFVAAGDLNNDGRIDIITGAVHPSLRTADACASG
jgi:large repetitive protein